MIVLKLGSTIQDLPGVANADKPASLVIADFYLPNLNSYFFNQRLAAFVNSKQGVQSEPEAEIRGQVALVDQGPAAKVANQAITIPENSPKDSETMQCAYRLWIQNTPYRTFTVNIVKLRLRDKEFDLPEAAKFMNNLLDIQTLKRLNENFERVMTDMFEQFNSLINKTLINELGDFGKDRLKLTYKPREDDPFAVFWIEHFIEDIFNIEFGFTYSTGPGFNVNVQYTNEDAFDGMVLTTKDNKNNLIKAYKVPAFSCRKNNIELCKGDKPKVSFNITSKVDNDKQYNFAGRVEGMNVSEIAAWIWDAPDATPSREPFYTGKETDGEFEGVSDNSSVRLTVITGDGCFSIFDKQFKQRPDF
jgi:hypothetical protein